MQYNAALALVIQPTGINSGTGKVNGNATGTATFTIDSTTVSMRSIAAASQPGPRPHRELEHIQPVQAIRAIPVILPQRQARLPSA